MNNLNKLKCIGLLSLFLLIFCFTTISSAETASNLILQEAQNEAAQLEAVRSALLLDYSEKYNQYLSDYKTWMATKTGPEPTEPLIGRDSSGNLSWTGALSYLPSGFGTASGSTLTRSDGVQYTLLATGDFVTVAVSNISAAAAELVPNYMPLASYDSATGKVSLLVTPETSGVAMELLNDVIENYVRRDGAGDPTFYDGATVTLGAGATLEWNNNDGQILGVSLLRGNNLAIQQIDTLSFGTGTLSLSQPSAGQLEIAGAGGSLYVEGPKLSSSTGDLILESSTVIATGEKLYIGDKGGAGTYSMSTANGELKMENSAGHVAFKRTGSQLQVNTDASEIYLTKNLRVSRVIGTADNALTADHATNADYATTAGDANSVGGKTWEDIKNYVQATASSSAGASNVLFCNIRIAYGRNTRKNILNHTFDQILQMSAVKSFLSSKGIATSQVKKMDVMIQTQQIDNHGGVGGGVSELYEDGIQRVGVYGRGRWYDGRQTVYYTFMKGHHYRMYVRLIRGSSLWINIARIYY